MNFFRRLLTNRVAEKMIIKKINAAKPGNIWIKMVPPNYLYAAKSIRKVSRNNINYVLDISNVVDHFIYFGFKERVFDPVKEEIERSQVIFDVGANIGTTSMYFASMNKMAKVFAFEPHPGTFCRAMENLQANNFRNIFFYQLGFGSKPDHVKLYEVNANNPGMNRVIPGNNDFPFVTITIDAIDNFVENRDIKKIDFIKIDVEGFESEVISGAKYTLQKQKPVLFLEVDDNNLRDNNSSAHELIKILLSYGYTSFYRADTNTPVNPDTDFKDCHYDVIARAL